MPESQTIHPLCSIHGERLARIETKLDDLNQKVGIQNGRVARTEDSLATISVKQGAHDVIQTEMMRTLIPLEASMGTLKDWRAGVKGGAESTAKLVRDWAMLIGLAVALWQGWTQREALAVQIEQVRQSQEQAARK